VSGIAANVEICRRASRRLRFARESCVGVNAAGTNAPRPGSADRGGGRDVFIIRVADDSPPTNRQIGSCELRCSLTAAQTSNSNTPTT